MADGFALGAVQPLEQGFGQGSAMRGFGAGGFARAAIAKAAIAKAAFGKAAFGQAAFARHSHSIVPGGFEVMSRATRFTPSTSPIIRLEMRSSRS